jgi:hypothetical protein
MTLRPEPDPAPDLTPTAGQLATVLADVADLHDEVTALRQVHGQADTVTEQLANRLAVLEALTPPTAGAAGAALASPYRYQELADWVDEVFARLAAAHRAKWCTNWAAHPEAHIRLEVLWHTWEAAMAAAPDTEPQWAAVDEWLRVRLDHHVDKLLDVDGPFAGCIPARGTDPGRCSAPPRLAQRPLVLAPDAAVARLDAAARLEAHSARARRHPVGARG